LPVSAFASGSIDRPDLGGVEKVHEHFGVFIPSGRAINPTGDTNWEGTGVAPDVSVLADRALPTAHLAALREIAADLGERRKDPKRAEPNRFRELDEVIKRPEKELGAHETGEKAEATCKTPGAG
jgi:hypothetical protein